MLALKLASFIPGNHNVLGCSVGIRSLVDPRAFIPETSYSESSYSAATGGRGTGAVDETVHGGL